ncbi:hypothetical protein [Alcanivorax sp. S71-1-4]|uniref:hypothetical protein n=1 Tax=Alcanivorax sp. S71-1-4 TaxID=1177159 RepID=UPI00135B5796|nr:hypothetical protein [Alcanivorax sp. S71-1-4]
MSRQKEELARLEDLYSTAQAIAMESEAIEECESHPGTFITCGDAEAEKMAYAIAENKRKNGELPYRREELMDAIKAAINDAGLECHSCAKWERE